MTVYFLIQFFCFVSIAYAQIIQVTELPENVNKTTCIALKNLRDSMVQRGLGEARKIRKVQLYLSGNGNVDVSVAIAIRFLDEGSTRPILHKCGEYQGTANDVMVTVSCIGESENADLEGYTGYAVYARFHGDISSSTIAICQMDIVLHDKYAQEKSQKMKSLVILTSVACGLIVGAAIGVIIWYSRTKKTGREEDELPSGVQYWEEEVPKEEVKNNKRQRSTVDNDYEDEVFLR
ncbi:hypothetical protein GHT06_016332 [Daphnia sinensis]|uniref:Uncharacterized protein n=1 Tax=Daphnia sinensis TaxID=1820382 RepID=A0AAD5KNG8_9CRUS|nr:hypothetical protein GHT06_016332 [Daphnia sinensis]